MDKIIGIVKSNRILIMCIWVIIIIIAVAGGYWCGYSAGYAVGGDKGTAYGENMGYEEGYSAGFNKGKEYIITNIDSYANNIKPVTFDVVAKFINEDQTDQIKSSDQFNCNNFSIAVKENANKRGIKCAYVSVSTRSGGHAINAFETTDNGVIFIEPQNDLIIGELSNLDTYMIAFKVPSFRTPFHRDYGTNTEWYNAPGPYTNDKTLSYLYGVTGLDLVW